MEQDYILQLIKELNERFDSLGRELRELSLSKESFNIYWNTIERDLRNLGDKIRILESKTLELASVNAEQDVKSAKISVKVGYIIGGASLLLGAIIGAALKYFL